MKMESLKQEKCLHFHPKTIGLFGWELHKEAEKLNSFKTIQMLLSTIVNLKVGAMFQLLVLLA